MTVSLLSFDCSETSVVIMDHLGVLLDGDEGPDSQPDGPLPVNVEAVHLLALQFFYLKALFSSRYLLTFETRLAIYQEDFFILPFFNRRRM